MGSMVVSEKFRAMFLVRPEAAHLLGNNCIHPAEIQRTKLADILRNHLHLLLMTRKQLLMDNNLVKLTDFTGVDTGV